LHLEGSGYLQQPGGGIVPGKEDTEWSVALRGTVSQLREIGPKTAHLPSLSLFGRGLSLKQNNQSDRIDQDVFTQYKAEHRAGLVLSDTLTYRPWLDTEWWGRVSLVSNEEIVLEKPDHLLLGAGWKQLIGDVQLDVDYRVIRFFSDTDRANAFTRHSLSFDLLWDFWRPNQHRLELGFGLRHDFDSGQTSGELSLTWHLGNGRAYRDFRPGEVDFPELRKRRAAQAINNRVLGVEQ